MYEVHRRTGPLTCFGEVESLLAKVGDQPEQGYKASEGGTDNIEVDQGQGRHVAICVVDVPLTMIVTVTVIRQSQQNQVDSVLCFQVRSICHGNDMAGY